MLNEEEWAKLAKEVGDFTQLEVIVSQHVASMPKLMSGITDGLHPQYRRGWGFMPVDLIIHNEFKEE